MARPYSDRSDLNMDERRLIELTDSDAAPGVPDEAVITKTGVDSDDLIDGMVAGVYVIPFDVVPPIIRLISARLRRVYLYEHRESIDMPPTVRDGGKWALDTLKMIQTPDGGMVLPGAARVQSKSPASSPSSGSIDSGEACGRKFGRKRDPLG
jgi:phage gp36-like protein